MIDVAIVGIGCRFPGSVHDADELWRFLLAKGDGMVDIPADRWNVDRFYDADPDVPGRMYTRRGGFLTDPLWDFDPEFFGISPREAQIMDPQQRLLLEVAVEALDDAGMAGRVAGRSVGVYVGGFMTDNQVGRHMIGARGAISSHTATSGTLTMLSNRLSYVLDLVGPSMTIDTACSSSLVAIHEAAQSIARGESELAIAGGVNAMLRPETFVSMCKGRFLAVDGRCKTFDASADGYARGEGAGAIILKPTADAVADGDRIYAVIRASGANQDGRTSGITVPNPVSQEALARRVLAETDLAGSEIGYVEAHGTGTAIGDPLEMEALGGAYGTAEGRRSPLVVGSIKASIGHLEAAAGVASVIKAALVVHHGTIPPQAWLDTLNPAIPFDGLNLRVPTEVERYPSGYEQVNVAVNGFGYGGTNAHVILQEPPAAAQPVAPTAAAPGERPVKVLPVSGRNDVAARALASEIADLVDATADADDLEALVDAAWSRRAHHPVRIGLPYEGAEDLSAQLRTFADGTGRAASRTVGPDAQRPAFVFSGMGPQWWRMGRDLLLADGPFARRAREIDECFVPISGWSIIDELLADAETSRVTRTEVAQPANFLVQVALVAELAAYGIEPGAVLGHSVGEVSAAYVSGALGLADALLVSFHRARLQATTAGTGGMLAVGLPSSDVTAWLEPEGQVCVAAVNSPSSVTLAGPVDELTALAERLGDAGIFARALRVEVPYHSGLMDPILGEVAACLAPLEPRVPTMPLYSSVTADAVTDATWGPSYWVDNVRQPVRFADAVARMVDDGSRVFVEVGPHPVLGGNIKEILVRTATPGSVVATLMRDQDDRARVAQSVAELYQSGSLGTATRPGRGPRPTPHVDLPAYPWQRTRLWTEEPDITADRLGDDEMPTLLGLRTPATGAEWEVELSASSIPWLADHVVDGVVVVPGAAYLDAALSAAALLRGPGSQRDALALEDVRFLAPLVISASEVPVMRVTVEDSTGRFRIQGRPVPGSSWTLHATGRIVRGSFRPGEWSTEPASTAARIDGTTVYDRLESSGLHYGPSFRRIRSLDVEGRSVVAAVDGTPGAAGEGRHAAHPTVVDAALQTVAVLVGGDDAEVSGPVVPASVRSVRLHAALPSDVVVAVNRHPGRGLVTDVALLGPDGSVAAEMLGVEFRPATPAASVTSQLERLWFEPVWEARPARVRSTRAHTGERTLVVALGEAAVARADAIARTREGAETLTCPVEVTALPDDDLLRALRRSLEDQSIGAVTVVVVAGPAAFPGTDVIGGLVSVARAIDEAVSVDASGDGSPPGDRTAVRGIVVTERAFAMPGDTGRANLGHTGLIGARRVLLNEQPAARWRLVDVDETTAAEQLDLELDHLVDDDADEVALRDGIRLVLRFARNLAEHLAPFDEAVPLVDPEASFRVERPASLLLSDLALRSVERRAPGPGEIEVRVVSAGLSYKDALKVLGVLTERQLAGTYYGTDIGMECIGDVVRVGPGVTRFAVGDRLMLGVRDCLARYLTLALDDGAMGIPPKTFSDVGAASNMVFLTAHHALVNCARPRPGETVLVHGAAGGVGLAAVQVARRLGVTVIGTASTPERRDAVLAAGADHVLDSRSLNFVEEVRALTAGRGADVIVSSAPGEILRANLDAVAEFGRVVEVGKADIYSGGVLDLAPFSRNISFIAIDIDRMFEHDRAMLMSVSDQVLAEFEAGTYTELPTTSYPLSQMREAFDAVMRSSHAGRVALRFDDPAPEVRPAVVPFPVRPDATYLVTGGFGAFGLATARWLAGRGARHLALAGRRGATTEAARTMVGALRDGGVEVTEALVDVADPESVRRLVATVGSATAPLRGVFHAAGILDDQPVRDVTGKSLHSVVEPKAIGAWNLHEATVEAGVALDAFVLYSSASAVTGTVSQLAYASANSMLDGLAHHRRAAGLPALSVNWGSLAGGGMAETSEAVQSYLAMIGLRPIDMGLAARTLDDCIRLGVTQVAVVDVDWARWASTNPATATSPRVSDSVAAAAEGASNAAALRNELLSLPEEQRAEVVAYMLADEVAGVLGIPAEAIDLDTPLPDLGLDSLMAVELGARVNMTFGLEVSALELSKGGGLTGLATRMLSTLTAGAAPVAVTPGSVAPASVATVDA